MVVRISSLSLSVFRCDFLLMVMVVFICLGVVFVEFFSMVWRLLLLMKLMLFIGICVISDGGSLGCLMMVWFMFRVSSEISRVFVSVVFMVEVRFCVVLWRELMLFVSLVGVVVIRMLNMRVMRVFWLMLKMMRFVIVGMVF